MNTSMKSTLPDITDWGRIYWNPVEQYVEKLQQRIYQAESEGDSRKVRNLQRMLLYSKANLLVSIRKVTQTDMGKRNTGIFTPGDRIDLYKEMCSLKLVLHNPKPAYRTYGNKMNDVSIIKDKVYQNIVKNSLEPQWEARFEPASYGFRPKRSALDAMECINKSLSPGRKQWIFEGDFHGCFDHFSHEYLLKQIQGFPAYKLIEKWLKAGFVDNKVFSVTEDGIQEGSVISPLLTNIVLYGIEEGLGINYTMTHYANNLVVMCDTKEDAENVCNFLRPYLDERGLDLKLDKTRIAPVTEGFDLLGFHARSYKTKDGSKFLIKPSKKSIQSCKDKLRNIAQKMTGQNAGALIAGWNPIIVGYTNDWSSVISKEIYGEIDQFIWVRTVRFLKRLHPKKSWKWMKQQYFKPDKDKQSKYQWILTDPITGTQLKRMGRTTTARHSNNVKTTDSISNDSDKCMLEPYVMKVTSTVLRRERGSNPSDLADKRKREAQILTYRYR